MVNDQLLKIILKDIKKLITEGKYTFVERDKNVDFLRDKGLNDMCVKEAILRLSPRDYIGGPELDRAGYEGSIYKFKVECLTDEVVYIKVRYNTPKEVVCISFHEDELT